MGGVSSPRTWLDEHVLQDLNNKKQTQLLTVKQKLSLLLINTSIQWHYHSLGSVCGIDDRTMKMKQLRKHPTAASDMIHLKSPNL